MTDRYAVIGNPIEHSKSPLIHAAFAKQTSQDIDYGRVLAPVDVPDGFSSIVNELIADGYKGANVTVPFKFEAFLKSQERTPRAQAAGAVNTLSFHDGGIIGDNTDGIGLVTDIKRNLGFDIHNKRVLLVGAGGAAFGVMLPLALEAPSQLIISNRTITKAQDAVAILEPFLNTHPGVLCEAKSFAELAGLQFDLVINSTSSGLDNAYPDGLPETLFADDVLAYDMMYGRMTPFMQIAKAQGAKVADGLGMLVEQAAEAFYIWRGIRPETAPVIADLRR